MGLTIFISNKDSHVRVLQWFTTALGCALEAPCGPVLHFEADEFRRVGLEVIRRHFIEYRTRRLTKDDPLPGFETRAEKRTLAGQRAVRVVEARDGRIGLIPIEIEKLSLIGLKSLPDATDQYVPADASQEVFWKAFDRALELSVSS